MVTSFVLLISITVLESMVGILGNGIILAVSSSGCIRNKTWCPYNMIMIPLSSSRIILHPWNTLDFLITIVFEPSYYRENVLIASLIIFMFLNCSSLWFGASLSVFYCVTVASFTQSFFIWLKQRIARLVPWMLLTSSLCSFSTAIPFAWRDYGMNNNFTAPLPIMNYPAMGTTSKDSWTIWIYFCNASTALPLILAVVSSVLLIRSLWVHTRQMPNNASGFRDPSLEAHMKAIKSVCSFLILYIIYFTSLLVLFFNGFSYLSNGESVCGCNGCLSHRTHNGLNLEQSKILRAAC